MAKTDKEMLDDTSLEMFFQAAREDTQEPSDALFAAIMADAEAHVPATPGVINATAEPTPELSTGGFFSGLLSAIGGWPALTGMATASVAGVWIGFLSPTQLETLSGGLLLSGDYVTQEASYGIEDLAPSYLGEGLFAEDEG